MIAAAGGIVERDGLVLVAHRPKYDDWTFPKGKRDPGETDEACALREVEEETGFVCELGAYAGTTDYTHRSGEPKQVHWWRMTVAGGEFTPNREVDEVRWVTPAEAAALLTNGADRALLARTFA